MGVKEGKGTGKTMLGRLKVSSVGELTISIGSYSKESQRDGCFPLKKAKTAVAQIEVMSSKVSLRWRLKIFRLLQVKATVEYAVVQD